MRVEWARVAEPKHDQAFGLGLLFNSHDQASWARLGCSTRTPTARGLGSAAQLAFNSHGSAFPRSPCLLISHDQASVGSVPLLNVSAHGQVSPL